MCVYIYIYILFSFYIEIVHAVSAKDGLQAICGIERRPIAALRAAAPGAKVLLGGEPLLRRGLLLLEPQNLEVLGAPAVGSAAGTGSHARRAQQPSAAAQLAVAPAAAAPAPAPAAPALAAVAPRTPQHVRRCYYCCCYYYYYYCYYYY